MTNHRKSVLINAAFEVIYEVLFECATEIVNELEGRDEFVNGDYIIKRGNRGTHIDPTITKDGFISSGYPFSQGTHNKDAENNRGLYFWIAVIKDHKGKNPEHYCITLSFTEISEQTNYPIIQIGKFQFWKECNRNVSPHEIINIDDKDITLKYNGSNSFDPEQAIFNGTYDVKKLVDSFMEFVEA